MQELFITLRVRAYLKSRMLSGFTPVPSNSHKLKHNYQLWFMRPRGLESCPFQVLYDN